MQIPVIWFKNKTDKEKESIEYILKNNRILLDALIDVLNEFEQEEMSAEITLKEYDSPSWSHKQADRNGARRAIRKVKTLFKFMETTS